MHILLAAAMITICSLVCSFIAYYSGVRTEQANSLTHRRDFHRARGWAQQLADANVELLAENASLRAGEEPLTPNEMIALSEIEYGIWESELC